MWFALVALLTALLYWFWTRRHPQACMASSSRRRRKRARPEIRFGDLQLITVPCPPYGNPSPRSEPPYADVSSSVHAWPGFEEDLRQWQQLHREVSLPLDKPVDEFCAWLEKRPYDAILPFVLAHDSKIEWHKRPAVGFPELSVIDRMTSEALLLGVRIGGMARLAIEMVANQVYFGLVVDQSGVSFCKRAGSQLFVHHARRVDCTAMGYMLARSMKETKPAEPLASLVYDTVPDMKGCWRGMCTAMAGSLKDPEKLVDRFCASLKWSSLEVELQPLQQERTRCFVLRTRHEGKAVVLKLRDLSKHEVKLLTPGDWELAMRETIREVDVYMRLGIKCQGSVVPNLRSFGMMEGGMLSFLMLSDERLGYDVHFKFKPSEQQCADFCDGGMAAIKALHARQLLYGRDVRAYDLVISRDCSRPKLVGFSDVQLAEAGSTFDAQCAEEVLSMKHVLDYMAERGTPNSSCRRSRVLIGAEASGSGLKPGSGSTY